MDKGVSVLPVRPVTTSTAVSPATAEGKSEMMEWMPGNQNISPAGRSRAFSFVGVSVFWNN